MVPTHSLLDGQATLANVSVELMLITRHELGRVGFVLTTTFPPSGAMQNVTRGQLSARAKPRLLTLEPLHAPAPPVGFVDVNTWPRKFTATHNRGDAHEIGPSDNPGVSAVIAQAPAPPSGFREISTPLACVPTHRSTDGHDRPVIPSGTANGSRWSISAGADQVIVDATAGPAKQASVSAVPVSASPLRTMPT